MKNKNLLEKYQEYILYPDKNQKFCPKEEDEQKIIKKYLDFLLNQGKIKNYHSNPNENILSFLDRKKTIMAQAKLKSMGAKKGVFDIYIFLDNKLLAIEMKRNNKNLSKISNEQLEWLDLYNSLPYSKGYICFGADKTIEIIEKELKNNS